MLLMKLGGFLGVRLYLAILTDTEYFNRGASRNECLTQLNETSYLEERVKGVGWNFLNEAACLPLTISA